MSFSSSSLFPSPLDSSTGLDPLVSTPLWSKVLGYEPNTALAVIALVLYLLISLPLSYLALRTRLSVTWVLVVTALFEALGYIFRLAFISNDSLGTYIIMDLLLLLPPNGCALVNYKVLGQVIALTAPPAGQLVDSTLLPSWRLPYLMDAGGLLRGDRIARVFFASDVVGFLLQLAGGGLEASGGSTATFGDRLLLVGLLIPLLFFALFTCLTIYVCRSPLYDRLAGNTTLPTQQVVVVTESAPSRADHGQRATYEPSGMRKVFFALFLTIALLFTRNIYRVVNSAEGYQGYLNTHEVYFYVFDTLVIFLAFVVYTVWHFGLNLPPTQPSTPKMVDGERLKETNQIGAASEEEGGIAMQQVRS